MESERMAYTNVFDRLAKTDTVASLKKREASQRKLQAMSPHSQHSSRTFQTSTTRMTSQTAPPVSDRATEFFNRLAYTETFASAQMKGKIETPPTPASTGKINTAFFNRLAKTDTFATATMKGKIYTTDTPKSAPPARKTTRAFFDRMTYTETFASKNMKGSSAEPVSNARPKTAKAPSSSSRKTSSSFFKRMASQETFSSANMKGKNDEANDKKPVRTPSQRTSSSFFDRLSKTETRSSASKKKTNEASPTSSAPTVLPYDNVKTTSSLKSFSSTKSRQSVKSTRSIKTTSALERRKSSRQSFTSNGRGSNGTSNSSSASLFRQKTSKAIKVPTSSILRPTASSRLLQQKETKPKPKPIRKTKPALQFDSDDDFSFDEEDDEIDEILSSSSKPTSVKEPEAGATASIATQVTTASTETPGNGDNNDPVTASSGSLPGKDEQPSLNGDGGKESASLADQDELGMDTSRVDAPQDQPATENGAPALGTSAEPDLSFGMSAEESDEEEDKDKQDVNEDREVEDEPVLEDENMGYDPVEDGSVESHEENDYEQMSTEEPQEVKNDDDLITAQESDHESIPSTVKTTNYKIFCSDKYHPEYGYKEIQASDLNLVDTLILYEAGSFTNEELAVCMIEAMFKRDFKDGDHWEIDPGTARELEEDEGGGGELDGRAFVVKQQARWDDEDVYSVAAAKGTVMIFPEQYELRMENYSYFVAG